MYGCVPDIALPASRAQAPDGRWKAQVWSKGRIFYSRRLQTPMEAARAADLLLFKAQGRHAELNLWLTPVRGRHGDDGDRSCPHCLHVEKRDRGGERKTGRECRPPSCCRDLLLLLQTPCRNFALLFTLVRPPHPSLPS